MDYRKWVGDWSIRVPCPAGVDRATNEVDSFLIADSDDDAAFVAKLIFMRPREDHCPCHACVGAQEHVEGLGAWGLSNRRPP